MTAPLDLLTLRLIIRVAESGSISAGSDRLGLAVAAASVRITALETQLGVRLFDRSSRGVVPTEAGRLMLQRGRELVAGADRLVDDLKDWQTGLAGHVRLLANASAMIEALPDRLDAFLRAHPRIRVDVEERRSVEILVEIQEGRADVGVVDLATLPSTLDSVPCFQDRLAVIVPRRHPLGRADGLQLADLLDQHFIALAGPNAVSMRLFNALEALGARIQIVLQSSSFDAATRMVAAGLGIAVLPKAAIEPQLRHLPIRAVALHEPWAERMHQLVTRRADDVPAAARTLVQALRQRDRA